MRGRIELHGCISAALPDSPCVTQGEIEACSLSLQPFILRQWLGGMTNERRDFVLGETMSLLQQGIIQPYTGESNLRASKAFYMTSTGPCLITFENAQAEQDEVLPPG